MAGYTQLGVIIFILIGLLLINVYADRLGAIGTWTAGIIIALFAVCALAIGIMWFLNSDLPNGGTDHELLKQEFNNQLKLQKIYSRGIADARPKEALTCESYVALFPEDCKGPNSPIVREGRCAWSQNKNKCVTPSYNL